MKEWSRLKRAEHDDQDRRAAFSEVMASLKFENMFPENIFFGSWSSFWFFESSGMFFKGFPDIVRALMAAENSRVCCLLNISETERRDFDEVATLYLDSGMTGHAYQMLFLKGDREGGVGYIDLMDRYGCASNIGDWCMYCEKDADVAVLALRTDENGEKYRAALNLLYAQEVEFVFDDPEATMPFNMMLPEWRAGFLANYGRRG